MLRDVSQLQGRKMSGEVLCTKTRPTNDKPLCRATVRRYVRLGPFTRQIQQEQNTIRTLTMAT